MAITTNMIKSIYLPLALPPGYWGTNVTKASLYDIIVAVNSSALTAADIPVTPVGSLTSTDVQSALEELQGEITASTLSWIDLAAGYKTTPIFNTTIAGGDVYDYVFQTGAGDVTYYRYIATDGSEDSFYDTFVGGVLSGLVVTKKITL